MKKSKPLIPATAKAAQPKQAEKTGPSVEMMVMQIGDHQRAIGELTTQLYNEVLIRERYIRSLPKPEVA